MLFTLYAFVLQWLLTFTVLLIMQHKEILLKQLASFYDGEQVKAIRL